MKWLKKYLPSIVSVAGLVATMFSGQIQGVIAAHPVLDSVGASILGIVAHFWPSPSQAQSASSSAQK